MANRIDIPTIVGKKAIDGLIKTNEELMKSNELLKANLKVVKDINKTYSSVKNNTQLVAALNKQEKENLKIQQEQNKVLSGNKKLEEQSERIRQQALKSKKAELDLSIKQKRETERLTKNKEKEAAATRKQNSAYEQLNKKYKESSLRAKDLAAKYGVTSKQAQKAAKEARVYKKRLDDINKSTRNSSGLFKSMAKGIVAATVAMVGIRTVFNVIKNNIRTIATFEEAMSKVRAVAGASRKEFKQLTENAKELGSSTSKTATQVSALQLEFSKLGFSTKEILAATEATISLSIAAGSDLAESAVVAASTVRGFGLRAEETQRIVDVMAKSFSSSALDLEKFKTAMGVVAPVAKAAGKDIEFTTAQLSVLADAGVDASTAGTSLRNMFLELNKQGLTWEQGLQKINDSTNKNVTALDLFGKRGATAALILADNIEKAEGLEEAYDGAAGSAEEMARIMEDNLIGDTKKLSSAWEGFVLGLNKGDGTITRVLRNAVTNLTLLVNKIKELNETEEEAQDRRNRNEAADSYKFFTQEVDKTVKSIKSLDQAEKERTRLIEAEIQSQTQKLEKFKKLSEEYAESNIQASFAADQVVIQTQLYIDKLQTSFSVISEATKLTDENTEATKRQAQSVDKIIGKTSELNEAWQDVIDTYGVDLAIAIKEGAKEHEETVSESNRKIIDDSAERVEAQKELEEKQTEDLRRQAEIRKQLTQAVFDQAVNLGNNLFDLQTANRNAEISEIEQNFNRRIKAAEGNEEKQEELEKRKRQQIYEVELEQAKANKKQARFNIATSTAVGIANAWAASASFGPAGPAIASFLTALLLTNAGIQLATVNAQPLPTPPQFALGSDNTPDTFIAGDGVGRSRELIIPKDGEPFLTPNHSTLYTGMKGAKVIPNAQTEQILNATYQAQAGEFSSEQLGYKLDRIERAVRDSKTKIELNKKGLWVEHSRRGKLIALQDKLSI
jgi:hypothetical protein